MNYRILDINTENLLENFRENTVFFIIFCKKNYELKLMDGTKTRNRSGISPEEAERFCGPYRTKMRNYE